MWRVSESGDDSLSASRMHLAKYLFTEILFNVVSISRLPITIMTNIQAIYPIATMN